MSTFGIDKTCADYFGVGPVLCDSCDFSCEEVRRSFRGLARAFSIVRSFCYRLESVRTRSSSRSLTLYSCGRCPSRPRPMVTPERYSAAVTGVCSGQERRAFLKLFYLRVAYGDILILKMHKPPMPTGVTK